MAKEIKRVPAVKEIACGMTTITNFNERLLALESKVFGEVVEDEKPRIVEDEKPQRGRKPKEDE